MDRLPDQLQPDLRLVFVGTAASTRSAADGHYYAHPGNRFWPTLATVGLTPRRYEPGEFTALLTLGYPRPLAVRAVTDVLETLGGDVRVEDVVRKALGRLSVR